MEELRKEVRSIYDEFKKHVKVSSEGGRAANVMALHEDKFVERLAKIAAMNRGVEYKEKRIY